MGLIQGIKSGIEEATEGVMGVDRTQKGLRGKHFSRNVGAGTDSEHTYEVPKDVTVEDVAVRIYAGAEDTLRLNIYAKDDETGNKSKIVDTPDDDDYIGGNDDYHEFDTSIALKSGDKIIVDYNNTDSSNAHRYKVNMSFEEAGGLFSLLPF